MSDVKDKIKPSTLLKICHGDDDKEGLENPRFILGYWGIRGLAAPLRMMLSAANVNHWIAMYDVTESDDSGWIKEPYISDKKLLKENYDPLMNLPFLVDCQEDFVLAQTNAIFAHLGRELKMLGSTTLETCRCEELLCEVMDLRNKMVNFAYPGDAATVKEDATKLVTSGAKGMMDKLELYLSTKYKDESDMSKVCYLIGSSCTAPDFHLWEMLNQFDGLSRHFELGDDSALAKRPFLSAFHENFAKLPENSAYLKSILAEVPYNNPYARFGSDPKTLGAYQRGQETPWKGKGVIEEMRTIDSTKKQKV